MVEKGNYAKSEPVRPAAGEEEPQIITRREHKGGNTGGAAGTSPATSTSIVHIEVVVPDQPAEPTLFKFVLQATASFQTPVDRDDLGFTLFDVFVELIKIVIFGFFSTHGDSNPDNNPVEDNPGFTGRIGRKLFAASTVSQAKLFIFSIALEKCLKKYYFSIFIL